MDKRTNEKLAERYRIGRHIIDQAQRFYAIYLASSGGKAHDGSPVPTWDEIAAREEADPAKSKVTAHWAAVAILAEHEHTGGTPEHALTAVAHMHEVPLSLERQGVWERYSDGALHPMDYTASEPA